jgi:hypothetical protein
MDPLLPAQTIGNSVRSTVPGNGVQVIVATIGSLTVATISVQKRMATIGLREIVVEYYQSPPYK